MINYLRNLFLWIFNFNFFFTVFLTRFSINFKSSSFSLSDLLLFFLTVEFFVSSLFLILFLFCSNLSNKPGILYCSFSETLKLSSWWSSSSQELSSVFIEFFHFHYFQSYYYIIKLNIVLQTTIFLN